jgi:Sulfotransferase domain
MIVGGHKCGTSSLKEYLSAHPDVVTHPQLEFTAFSRKGHSEPGEAEQLDKLLGAAGGRLTLAKHAGVYAEPFALDRLREASPECKLLLILRDPVARARSAFRMETLKGVKQEPFGEVISRVLAMEREGQRDWRAHVYLHLGLYGKWLNEMLARFPEGNVKVLFLEELEEDPEPSYRECCRWLGLDPAFSPDLEARHNVGADPRSALLARALKRLQSERNPLKRASRRILPESAYLRIAEMARNANRAERSKGDDSSAIDERLREYFEEDSDVLSRRLGRDLPWSAVRSAP